MIDFSKKRLFLFDLEGVLYRGKERPIKIGGTEVIEKLRQRGRKIFILTNDSTHTPEQIHRNLSRLGIPVREEEILSVTRLTAEYIRVRYGEVSYFLVGEEGLDRELRRAGLRRTHRTDADVLVVGLDRSLTYQKLDMAVRVVRKGAPIIATHKARLYMNREGPAVAVGAIVKAIEYATRRRAVAIGKPSPLMFHRALRQAGCSREEAVMIGDQLETDILGATRLGIDAVLVLTGVEGPLMKGGPIVTVKHVDELTRYIP